MADHPTTPEIHDILLPGTAVTCRLTRVRLADVPAGAVITRRSRHQVVDELTGADAYDLVAGLSLRTTRALDPVLADSLVWQVEIRLGGA